jgi:hypothetical protein
MSVTHALSSVVSPTTTQVIENTPPIAQIIPFVSKAASLLVVTISYASSVVAFLFSFISYPTFLLANAPLQFVFYVLSPFVVFGQIILGVFFVTPYHVAVDFFVAVQPFYVFCGVACISGAVIGLSGRVIASVASSVIMGPEGVEKKSIELAPLSEKPSRREMWQ